MYKYKNPVNLCVCMHMYFNCECISMATTGETNGAINKILQIVLTNPLLFWNLPGYVFT